MKARIEVMDWAAARKDAQTVRFEVFVREQGVPAELEMDERDANCRHALAYVADEGRETLAGTGRLLPEGRIGRMAVLGKYRGQGVGGAILEALIREAACLGMTKLELHAQVRAIPFYACYGFVADGDEFVEAGIVHRSMRRDFPEPS